MQEKNRKSYKYAKYASEMNIQKEFDAVHRLFAFAVKCADLRCKAPPGLKYQISGFGKAMTADGKSDTIKTSFMLRRTQVYEVQETRQNRYQCQ